MNAVQQADLQKAIKKTLHSTALAKLIGQAIHTALAEVEKAQAETIMLPTQPLGQVRFSERDDYRSYTARSADGRREIHMQLDRNPTLAKHRGSWYGYESRTDTNGQTWSRYTTRMVQDDFGFLVEAPV